MTSRARQPGMHAIVVACAGLLVAGSSAAWSQDYPSRSIRLIVAVPAGSGPDSDARYMAARIGPLLGQPVVVENRPGAGTRIAMDGVAKAAPDGYTLLFGTPSLATAPALYAKLAFDIRRDLAPISLLALTSYALTINSAVPAQTVAAYAALARLNPAHANVATYGIGTIPHLAAAWFGNMTGSDLKFIHYNTTPPFNDLLAGQTTAIFDSLLAVGNHVRSGRLRVLAVSGKTRNALLPEVPTFAEAGFADFDPQVWNGILAPAGTPRAIIDRVQHAIAEVARMREVIAYRRGIGSESVSTTPEEFAAFIEAERVKWAAVIKQAGVRLE